MKTFIDNESYLKNIGKRIALARIEKNITQSDLAKKSNIHRVTISEIENGSPTSILTLLNILRSLDLLDVLNDLINFPKSYKEIDYSKLFNIKSVSIHTNLDFKNKNRDNKGLKPSLKLIKELQDNTL